MATVTSRVQFGPRDHGRPMTLEEFRPATTRKGINTNSSMGSSTCRQQPNLPEGRVDALDVPQARIATRSVIPTIINYVYGKCRVFVPGRRRTTCPEPDITAYHDFPLDADLASCPLAGCQSDSGCRSPVPRRSRQRSGPQRGPVPSVPSIKEYWLIDSERIRTGRR